MTVKELLLVILSAAVADNLVLSGYFGFDSSVLGANKKSFSLCLGAVIIVSTLICSLLHGVLVSMGVEYMEIMVFALVILLVSAIAVKLMGEKAPSFAWLSPATVWASWKLSAMHLVLPSASGCCLRYLHLFASSSITPMSPRHSRACPSLFWLPASSPWQSTHSDEKISHP